MFACNMESFWKKGCGLAVAVIAACAVLGSTGAHAQVFEAGISLEYAWGISNHPALGDYLYLEGRFTKPMEGMSLVLSNPRTGEEATLFEDAAVAAGRMFCIDPARGWVWQPGERLTITVQGRSPVMVDIPLKESFNWSRFIRDAQDYSSARARGAGLAARPLSNDAGKSRPDEQWPSAPREPSREDQDFQRWFDSVQNQQLQDMWNNTFGGGSVSPFGPMPFPGPDDDIMSPFGPMSPSPGASLPQDSICPTCNGTRFHGKTPVPGYGLPGPPKYVDKVCPQCGGAGRISR